MSETIIPRDHAASELSVPARLLIRYEARGLIRTIREGDIEGYAPADVRRLWSIVSYQRDMGINLAGVEAVLKLRDHIEEIHRRLRALAGQIRDAATEDDDARETGRHPESDA